LQNDRTHSLPLRIKPQLENALGSLEGVVTVQPPAHRHSQIFFPRTEYNSIRSILSGTRKQGRCHAGNDQEHAGVAAPQRAVRADGGVADVDGSYPQTWTSVKGTPLGGIAWNEIGDGERGNGPACERKFLAALDGVDMDGIAAVVGEDQGRAFPVAVVRRDARPVGAEPEFYFVNGHVMAEVDFPIQTGDVKLRPPRRVVEGTVAGVERVAVDGAEGEKRGVGGAMVAARGVLGINARIFAVGRRVRKAVSRRAHVVGVEGDIAVLPESKDEAPTMIERTVGMNLSAFFIFSSRFVFRDKRNLSTFESVSIVCH